MINQTALATLTIGQGKAPCLLLLSTSKTDVAADLIPWAKEIACAPSTLWNNLDNAYSLLEEAFPFFIKSLGLSEKQGFFMVDCQSDPAKINSPFFRFLFFLYPPGLDPIHALQILDQQLEGKLPPALVAALVAVAHGFEHGHLTLEGVPAIFAQIADPLPSIGPSTLSDKDIMHLIEQFVDCSNHAPIPLVSALPNSALDCAKFLVALSEMCWQPSVRNKHFNTFSADPALARIASAWLSSGPTFVDSIGVSFAETDFSYAA